MKKLINFHYKDRVSALIYKIKFQISKKVKKNITMIVLSKLLNFENKLIVYKKVLYIYYIKKINYLNKTTKLS